MSWDGRHFSDACGPYAQWMNDVVLRFAVRCTLTGWFWRMIAGRLLPSVRSRCVDAHINYTGPGLPITCRVPSPQYRFPPSWSCRYCLCLVSWKTLVLSMFEEGKCERGGGKVSNKLRGSTMDSWWTRTCWGLPQPRKRIRQEEEMGITHHTHTNLLWQRLTDIPLVQHRHSSCTNRSVGESLHRRCRIIKEFIMTMTIIQMLNMWHWCRQDFLTCILIQGKSWHYSVGTNTRVVSLSFLSLIHTPQTHTHTHTQSLIQQ
jgi:hypothetical protein